ncbi:MAG: deoxyribodipyrimidine photo-lyase [Hyphomicrobiales bacterium]
MTLLPVYILDYKTPGNFCMGGASRWWLHHSLAALDDSLKNHGGALCLRTGEASKVLASLLDETGASAIHATKSTTRGTPSRRRRSPKRATKRAPRSSFIRDACCSTQIGSPPERRPLQSLHTVLEGLPIGPRAPCAAAAPEARTLRQGEEREAR